jgi:hypothetical protein
MKSAYTTYNPFLPLAIGLTLPVSMVAIPTLESLLDKIEESHQLELKEEYNQGRLEGDEQYLGNHLFGLDLDNDGITDIRLEMVPIGRAMYQSQYFDLR